MGYTSSRGSKSFSASSVILSRTDGIRKDKLDDAVEIIRSLNSSASLITTPWDQLDGKVILETMEKRNTLEAELQHLLEELKPEALCVAYDRKEPTFRHKSFDFYKAQRKPMPEELAVQMPLLKEVLDAMGIPRLELAGYEADDILGTLSRIAEEQGDHCFIVTGDKDSLQLVSDGTTVCNVKSRMGQTETILYTPERFREEYGFEPPLMVDLKALMGDSSDNIPGVPGIGEKTAMDLVRRYGGIGEIYRDPAALDVKETAVREVEATPVKKKTATGKTVKKK